MPPCTLWEHFAFCDTSLAHTCFLSHFPSPPRRCLGIRQSCGIGWCNLSASYLTHDHGLFCLLTFPLTLHSHSTLSAMCFGSTPTQPTHHFPASIQHTQYTVYTSLAHLSRTPVVGFQPPLVCILLIEPHPSPSLLCVLHACLLPSSCHHTYCAASPPLSRS